MSSMAISRPSGALTRSSERQSGTSRSITGGRLWHGQPATTAAVQPGMRRTILLLALLTLTIGAAWRRGDAYMLHAGKTDVTMMGGMPVSELPALHRRLGDTSYLWVRLGTREWLIRDETLLREATALWAPIQALEREQHGLGVEYVR